MTSHPPEPKLPESLEAIRAALNAGPTKGPFIIQWGRQRRYPLGIHNGDVNIVTAIARPASNEAVANALLFAACNPEAITALLDALKARDAEIERLRAERDGLVDMYQRFAEAMDYTSGKDGMEFSPEEWGAALKADAERYRLLRRGQKWSVIDGIGNTLRADALDAAIDQARATGGEKAK